MGKYHHEEAQESGMNITTTRGSFPYAASPGQRRIQILIFIFFIFDASVIYIVQKSFLAARTFHYKSYAIYHLYHTSSQKNSRKGKRKDLSHLQLQRKYD